MLPTLRSPRLSSAAAVAAAGLIALLVATQAEAVIVTGTAGNNTSAPTDSALAIRWGQVGIFSPSWGDGFLGTPISSNVFITAKHIAGSVGDKITMADGTQHTTIAMFNDPSSDLALWQIADTFPSSLIVPLYTSGSVAVNAPMYIFGVGSARGAEVDGNAFGGGTELKGWRWGAYDDVNPVKSWGTNNLAGLYNFGSAGLQLGYSFSTGVSDNEGTLGYGDSGGPVFIQQTGVWSLAAINYGVDSRFNTTNTGGGFYAAIFDAGGLYTPGANSTWVYNQPAIADDPAYAYSTSTTNRLDWINQTVAAVPEPSSIVLALVGVCTAAAARRTRK